MTNTGYHVPVMVDPVLRFVREAPPGVFVDGTLGGGGHSFALAQALEAAGESRIIVGVDQDPEALAYAQNRLAHLGDRFRIARGNFRDIDQHVAQVVPGEPIAAILLDLGVSSHQLDAEHRGFAIKHPDSALDMRMNFSAGRSAKELIADSTPDEIASILREFGEVKEAWRLAKRIKEASDADKLHTTGDLARLVELVTPRGPRKLGVHPATLVFQALRIAVNDEMGALDDILAKAPAILCPGGRLLVMSYHSLEDRRAKQAFHAGEHGPERPARLPPPSDWQQTWRTLTRQPVMADEAEVKINPRARSAKMRIAARVHAQAWKGRA